MMGCVHATRLLAGVVASQRVSNWKAATPAPAVAHKPAPRELGAHVPPSEGHVAGAVQRLTAGSVLQQVPAGMHCEPQREWPAVAHSAGTGRGVGRV